MLENLLTLRYSLMIFSIFTGLCSHHCFPSNFKADFGHILQWNSLPKSPPPSKVCYFRVGLCFVCLQQLTLAICLVARCTLYLHCVTAFSQALHAAGMTTHNSLMRNALCLVSQLVLAVQLTSVGHMSRRSERVINMATFWEVWGEIRDVHR